MLAPFDAAPLGYFDVAAARQVVAGQGLVFQEVLLWACGDDLASADAGAGSDVDDVVGAENHIAVVLDDDDRVAEVAQLFEGIDQSAVVALVQTNRGLVEDVEHVDQLGADLRCQADALAFAAAERLGTAVERQVSHADVDEEAGAGGDFAQYFVRHLAAVFVEFFFQSADPVEEFRQVHFGHLADVLAVDEEAERLLLQAVSVAAGAGHGVHKARGPFLDGCRLLVGGHLVDIVGYARESAAIGAFGVHLYAHIVAGAVEDDVHRLVAEAFERVVEREMVARRQVLQLAVHIVRRRVFAQHVEAAVADALLGVGDYFLEVDFRNLAQAVASGAGSVWRVERECVGLRLGIGEARVGVHQHTAEVARLRFVAVFQYHQHPFALLEGGLDGLFQSAVAFLVDAHAVHHKLDVVRLVAVHLHIVGQLADFAVHAHAQVSFFSHLLKQFAVVALAAAHQRREDEDVLVGEFRCDDVDDLAFAVFYHLLTADVRIGVGDTRKEQADKVVDFGDGAHRRARVLVGGFLFDGDDGAQAVDAVNVGPFHIADKVARVGREGLHITALAFGIDGVER